MGSGRGPEKVGGGGDPGGPRQQEMKTLPDEFAFQLSQALLMNRRKKHKAIFRE
jgi:hypothetical protein